MNTCHGDFDAKARQFFVGFIIERINCVCANSFVHSTNSEEPPSNW